MSGKVEKTSEHLVRQIFEYEGEGKYYAEILEVMSFKGLNKEEIKFRLELLTEIIEDGSVMPDSIAFKIKLIDLLRKK